MAFDIDTSEIRKTAFTSVTWTALETYSRQGMQFVVSVVLARLLFPEDFGLVAIVMVFVSIASTFVDSGLSAALIQKQGVTVKDENTIFYTNIIIALGAYTIVWCTAPYIAIFYRMPPLTLLVRTIALSIVISSFSLIQTTLLTKQLNFRVIFTRTAIAIPISGALGIAAAYRGLGVWSLAIQYLSDSFISLICYWLTSRWRPKLVFSMESLKSLLGYSSRQLGTGLLNTVFEYIYEIVIGRLFSVATLGLYTRASHIQKLVTNNLTSIPYRVAFPLLSAVNNDENLVRNGTARLLKTMSLFVFPVMMGLMVVAKPLVEVLLTAKWLASVPFLQLLCIVGLVYPLHVANVNVLRVRGKMQVFLNVEIAKKALTILAVLVTWRYGIIAMIWGQIAQSILAFFLNAHFGGGSIGYGSFKQLKDVTPYACLTGLMALAVLAVSAFNVESPLMRLILQSITGAAIYIGLCHIFKPREYIIVLEWLRDSFKASRKKLISDATG